MKVLLPIGACLAVVLGVVIALQRGPSPDQAEQPVASPAAKPQRPSAGASGQSHGDGAEATQPSTEATLSLPASGEIPAAGSVVAPDSATLAPAASPPHSSPSPGTESTTGAPPTSPAWSDGGRTSAPIPGTVTGLSQAPAAGIASAPQPGQTQLPQRADLDIEVPQGARVPVAFFDEQPRTPQQRQVIEEIMDQFARDVQGASPPTGGTDSLQWRQAAERADQRYRIFFGDDATNYLQMKAAREALQEKQQLGTAP